MPNPATLYIILPDHDNGTPSIFTGNAHDAPPAAPDQITAAAQARIDTALNRVDVDTCATCGTPIGYHFDATNDPEIPVNDAFYVTPDGTALCEECGEPAADG